MKHKATHFIGLFHLLQFYPFYFTDIVKRFSATLVLPAAGCSSYLVHSCLVYKLQRLLQRSGPIYITVISSLSWQNIYQTFLIQRKKWCSYSWWPNFCRPVVLIRKLILDLNWPFSLLRPVYSIVAVMAPPSIDGTCRHNFLHLIHASLMEGIHADVGMYGIHVEVVEGKQNPSLTTGPFHPRRPLTIDGALQHTICSCYILIQRENTGKAATTTSSSSRF